MALPKEVEHGSLTTIRQKLVKIGAEVVAHGRYLTVQMAEGDVCPNEMERARNRVPNAVDGRKVGPAGGNAARDPTIAPARLLTGPAFGRDLGDVGLYTSC